MQGTAFYLRDDFRVYLFSALHNFTGIDPETRKLIKGLSVNPKDIWVWQPFDFSPKSGKFYQDLVKDSLAYSIYKDSLWAYLNRPDKGKNYKLYDNRGVHFLGKSKDTDRHSYDIGSFDVSDSIPSPRHILDFNKVWDSEIINVGDTIFYWGFILKGNRLSEFPSKFIGKIVEMPSTGNPYITSDIFSRVGSSGAAVFKLSKHRVSLIGVIARGNSDKSIVLITPFKEAFNFLKL